MLRLLLSQNSRIPTEKLYALNGCKILLYYLADQVLFFRLILLTFITNCDSDTFDTGQVLGRINVENPLYFWDQKGGLRGSTSQT